MAEVKALEMTFGDVELPFQPEYIDAYRAINKEVWHDFELGLISQEVLRTHRFERLFEPYGLKCDIAVFSELYLGNLGRCGDLVAGAEELLATLNGHFHIGMITNGIADVQRPRLANSPIVDRFEIVAISEEVGAAKPDVRFFDAAFNMMGHPDRKTVLVI
jgi:FMN phosphatase YigB (HAD superfamily)